MKRLSTIKEGVKMTIEAKREITHDFCMNTDCADCPMKEEGICSILISMLPRKCWMKQYENSVVSQTTR